MTNLQPRRFKTISEFHRFRGLPKPEHPLISVINLELIRQFKVNETSLIWDFYAVALKRNFNAKMKYGQQEFDFEEGTMSFVSPGQVIRIVVEKDSSSEQSGWLLLIHPDFLWNTSLAKIIKQYGYFDYSVNLIKKAKESLTTTSFSVGEIAYRLGFEHPQSFNKLFKNKTNVSPLEFRNSFQ